MAMAGKRPRGTRTGFTTGACAAAAARAAMRGLVAGRIPGRIDCLLPNGQIVAFTVDDGRVDGDRAHAVVVKDAGDDPDCTHGAHLTADLHWLPGSVDHVLITAGEGVGTITQPGLGLEVGGPAINPVPRENIEANVRLACEGLLAERGVEVRISVPEGEAMARKTLNARLGIVGGISILGTTGIVRPYSTAAFRASVVQGVEVAAARGQDTVVLTTGGRTERFVMAALPELDPVCFVQMGDFLSYALDTAARTGMRRVVIGGMVGKLTKMAQGETITHAGRAEVDTGLLAEIAADCGAPEAVCEAIREAETARYAAEQMEAIGLGRPFHTALAQRVVETLKSRYGDRFDLEVLVCDFSGNRVAEARSNDDVH